MTARAYLAVGICLAHVIPGFGEEAGRISRAALELRDKPAR